MVCPSVLAAPKRRKEISVESTPIKMEASKNIIQQLLSEEKAGKIYGKRKVEVEAVLDILRLPICVSLDPSVAKRT
ncbi:hypothetical protein F6Y02_02000 [Bacillus megaterium]|nr:hypothetical protein [Priestia megaterium]